MFDRTGPALVLVESEGALADLMTLRLELLDYRVDTLHTADATLQNLEQLAPDLLIIDSVLADGDGIELIRTIRQSHIQYAPILMFSIELNEDLIEAARLAGAQDYLQLPLDCITLERKVKQLIEAHSQPS